MRKEIPRNLEGYQEINGHDLPYYEPHTEEEEQIFKKKIRSVNMTAIIMLLISIVLIGIVLFSPDEYYADPVWKSKLIVIFIAGLTVYMVFRSVINGFVLPRHKTSGKVGKIQSVHWHSRKSKTGYAVVSFPDDNKVIKQVIIDRNEAKTAAKGDEILVVSFNGKAAYGFVKDKYLVDIPRKKKSSIINIVGSVIFVAIFSIMLFGTIKTDMNTEKYEAQIIETRYLGTERRYSSGNKHSTVHIEEAEVYIEELNETARIELSGNNKTHLPEKGRVIKVSKSNGEWIRHDGMLIFYIGFGIGLLVGLYSLFCSIFRLMKSLTYGRCL